MRTIRSCKIEESCSHDLKCYNNIDVLPGFIVPDQCGHPGLDVLLGSYLPDLKRQAKHNMHGSV